MTIKIVYFAYLLPNKWQSVVSEQLDALKSCGIYNDAANIYMCVVGDEVELNKFDEFIKKYSKVEVSNKSTQNSYEYLGIKKVYDISKNDDDEFILYFHTKGITHKDELYARLTRLLMMASTVENYKEITFKFQQDQKIDVVGAMPHVDGFMYNTFFWVRSSYVNINFQQPVVSDNRYVWEIWTGKEYSRKKTITTYSPLMGYTKIFNKKDLHPIWELLQIVYMSNKIKNSLYTNTR